VNKERRKAIDALVQNLTQWRDATELAFPDLDLTQGQETAGELRDEEQEYFDNMSENLKGGERGQNAESAIASLENAAELIEQARDSFESAMSQLQEAMDALEQAKGE
jgi:hypothetical protein